MPPALMLSIVAAIRAIKASGTVSAAIEAKSLILVVTAARPAIKVKLSML